jgi:hypothetical protein
MIVIPGTVTDSARRNIFPSPVSNRVVAYGLCRWAFAEDVSDKGSTLGEVLSAGWQSLKSSFRSLLP